MHDLDPSKELRLLLAFFGESRLPLCRKVAAEEIPEPERGLLVHHSHMTVTLEEHNQSRVRVVPYEVCRRGDLYGRKLDLETENSGLVVMTGILLINLGICGSEVRQLIEEEIAPLGRILIEHGVLRRITTESFLRLESGDALTQRFGFETPVPAYGRLATIFYEGQPAIDLLEIVRPEHRGAGDPRRVDCNGTPSPASE